MSELRNKRRLPSLPVAAAPSVERSATMRAVKSSGTRPERIVREMAHAIRPGYRLNRADILGKPDIAYGGAKMAIFVHGCFWHGHDCARGARIPKNNCEYWVAKVARNVARDRRNLEALAQAGWQAMVIWECELKQLDAVALKLRAMLEK